MNPFPSHESYESAKPFPHAVIDGAFPQDLIQASEAEFPPHDALFWQRFANPRENKVISADPSVMGKATWEILARFTTPDFISKIEAMTGIKGLDPDFYGGGMHLVPPGGMLAIHTDFNQGPKGYRRLNALLFLNSGWQAEWGGDLELWAIDKAFSTKISPVANRLVVFTTSERSFHGHPHPLSCPPGVSRKSIAVYYFTKDAPPDAVPAHSTIFME